MFSDWLKRGCSDIIRLQQWADVMIDFEWDEWFLISGSRLFVRPERAPDEYIWFYSLRLVSLTPMKKNLSVQIKNPTISWRAPFTSRIVKLVDDIHGISLKIWKQLIIIRIIITGLYFYDSDVKFSFSIQLRTIYTTIYYIIIPNSIFTNITRNWNVYEGWMLV